MPVIMTGSPGGPLGGGSGSAFGSGLGGLSTSPSKLFTPNLEVWTRRAEEDRQMVDERKAEYDSMRNMRLAMVSEQNRQGTDKKKKAKDDFAARQKARLEAEAAEKERLKQWRLESLEKNKVDHKMDMREGEPGYGPTRWCWPTAHHHPRMCASGVDVAVDFVLGPGALLAASASAAGESGSPQTGDSEMLSLAEKLPNHLQEMKLRACSRHILHTQAQSHERAAVDPAHCSRVVSWCVRARAVPRLARWSRRGRGACADGGGGRRGRFPRQE